MNRVEAHVREVLGGRLRVELSIDCVATLEPDHVAVFDRQNWVQRPVPGAVDVAFGVREMVVDRVTACSVVRLARVAGIVGA
jgi:hypothetical protein